SQTAPIKTAPEAQTTNRWLAADFACRLFARCFGELAVLVVSRQGSPGVALQKSTARISSRETRPPCLRQLRPNAGGPAGCDSYHPKSRGRPAQMAESRCSSGQER